MAVVVTRFTSFNGAIHDFTRHRDSPALFHSYAGHGAAVLSVRVTSYHPRIYARELKRAVDLGMNRIFILNVGNLANGGSNSSIGKSTNAAANLVFGGNSTLRVTQASTTDRNFTINNGVTATFDTQQALTISGSAVASTGGLTKFGGSSLTLSGVNLYTGATTVNAGSLILDFASGVPTGSGDQSNKISNLSALVLAGGTLALNGDPNKVAVTSKAWTAMASAGTNLYTLTSSGNGTLFGFGSPVTGTGLTGAYVVATAANTVTVYSTSAPATSGTDLAAAAFNPNTSQTFNGLTLNSGGSTVTLTQNSGTSTTAALGAITRNAGSTLNFSVAPLASGVIATTTNTNSNNILGPWATTGTGASLKYATQTGVSNQIGAYSGGTAAGNATLLTDTTGAVNYDLAAATGTMPATVSANTIRYTGGTNSTTLGSSFTVNGLMNAGNGFWTIGNGTLTIGANQELVVQNTSGATTSINSVIQDSLAGSSALTITSGATNTGLTLGGANTYSGATYVNGGQLSISAANNLGNSTQIYLNNATLVSSANTYDLGNTRTIFLGGNGDTIQANAGTLTVSGNVDNGGNGLLTVAGAGSTTISGVVGNAGGTGNGGLTMSGTSTLTLTNANTYRGDTTISLGTVNIRNALALGTAEGGTTLAANTTLQLQSVSGINFADEALTFSNSATSTLQNLSGNNTWSGPIWLAGYTRLGIPTITANVGTTLTIAGTVNTGTNQLLVTGAGDTTITGSVGYGFVGVKKTGAGTLSLQGTNTYLGQTTVSQGVLAINSDAALGAAYDGSLGYINNTNLGSGYGTTGAGVIVAAPTTAGGTTALPIATSSNTVSAALTGVNGSGYIYNPTVTFVGTGTGATADALVMGLLTLDGGTLRTDASITSNRAVVITSLGGTIDTNGNTSTFSGIINNGASGTGGLTKIGAGTLALTGSNLYAGKTVVQNGTVSFTLGNASAAAAQSLGENAALDLGAASTSSGTLNYTGTGAATLAKNINALGNGTDTIQNSGTGLLTLAGTLTKNGTKLTLNGGANGITVTGTIVGSSAGSDLIVTGGTTTLTQVETYNGPTYVQGSGTLVNGNSGGALPAGTTLYIGGTDNSTGTFDLNGNGQTVAALNSQGTGGASNVVTNGGGSDAALTVSGGGTFAGKIQNGATNKTSLAVTGGTLALSGANTYTGTTTVSSSGTLLINGDQSTATGNVTVANTATLGGHGKIGGAVEVQAGGFLTPGSTGVLTVGSLTLDSSSTTRFVINGTAAPGTDYDQISVNVGGGLALNGAFTINFTNSSNLANTTNINLFVFTAGHSGDFTSLVATGYSAYAGTWTRDAANDAWFKNTGPQLLTFSEITGNLIVAVPEPSTWALLAFSLTTVMVLRRRRNS